MISTANPVLRHRALLLGTSAALALVLVKPAAAQCVVEPDNIITCSGDNDDQQTLNNGGSLTVTTEPGFSIDSPDNGLVISGTGSLIYNDSNASTIIGRGYDGIAVGNGGGGASRIEIRTAGDVTGGGRAGIITNNLGTGGVLVEATGTVTGALTGITIVALAGSGGDAEVISNNAAGGSSGIGVENRGGTGAIRITSTGTVQATGSEGFAILGLHSVQGAGGDLVIVANDISGAGGGINASNAGGASTNIAVNGTLNVASRQGISVGNGAAAKDITVTVRGSLTSGATGIAINNQGQGQTIVTAEQQIRSNNVRPQEAATSGNGMNITTGGSAGDLVARVAGVEGRAGIVIRNLGQGALTLSASGLVEGREAYRRAQQQRCAAQACDGPWRTRRGAARLARNRNRRGEWHSCRDARRIRGHDVA